MLYVLTFIYADTVPVAREGCNSTSRQVCALAPPGTGGVHQAVAAPPLPSRLPVPLKGQRPCPLPHSAAALSAAPRCPHGTHCPPARPQQPGPRTRSGEQVVRQGPRQPCWVPLPQDKHRADELQSGSLCLLSVAVTEYFKHG